MRILPIKTILFASSDADERDIEAAKDYIRQRELTDQQVRIVKRAGQICVETKVELPWV